MTVSWSNVPDFTADPERKAAVAEATIRDKEQYLRGGLAEIECRACHACHACHACAMVKKYSPHHTSVQWTSQARDHCPSSRQFAPKVAIPRCCRRARGCRRASITV